MSNSKVLLFGSFTEDETRSLLLKQSSGTVRNEKPAEKDQLQFGSVNAATVESSNRLNSQRAPDSAPPSHSQNCNGVSSVSGNSRGASGIIKENGSIVSRSIGPSSTVSVNEVKEDNVDTVSSLDDNGPSNVLWINRAGSPYQWIKELRWEDSSNINPFSLLLECAKFVACGSIKNADIGLEYISHLLSPDGAAAQRTVTYFSEALAFRIVKNLPGVYKALNSSKP